MAVLALRMEADGLHPFHASAVRYRGKTVLFLGGESNHGKSMGQIEACRRGALLGLDRDDGHRRGRARGHGLEGAVHQEAHRGHRAGRQGRARGRASRSSSAGCRPGSSTPSRATSTSSSCRPSTATSTRPGRDDPVRAPVPDPPLAAELLPAQRAARRRLADADGRHRAAPPGAAPGGFDDASASARSTSSAPPPRRCSWTRSTRSSKRRRLETMQTFAYARPATAGRGGRALLEAHGPDARVLAGGTDLIIRLRDGSADAGRRDRRQADRRASRRGSARTTAA